MQNHLELLTLSAPAIIKLATFVPFAFAVALYPGWPAEVECIGKAQLEGSRHFKILQHTLHLIQTYLAQTKL
jgi:hypothetical protein